MFISKKTVYHWLQKLYILHCLWEKQDKLYRITFPYYRRSLNKNQTTIFPFCCNPVINLSPFSSGELICVLIIYFFALNAIFSRSYDPSRNMTLEINFNVLISPLICIADLASLITPKLIQWFFFIKQFHYVILFLLGKSGRGNFLQISL